MNYLNFMVGGGFANYPRFLAYLAPLWILLIIWSLVWKGWALWTAARKGSKSWFVALLIVNTLGILEILYIYVFSKKSEPTLGANSSGAGAAPAVK